MDEELNEIIKATQVSLGKYVKRPPLTDKLLNKPPFRFLHDIVTSVMKTTDFFKGLFEEEELISDNVKDRDSKLLFLNKVISVISITTGKTLSIKPSKIIAGQEADKTNELLQYLALALDNNLSTDEAVKQYKESVKVNKSSEKRAKDATKPRKKSTDTNKISSKGSDKSIKSDKTISINTSKLSHKDSIIIQKDSPPKKSTKLLKKIHPKEKQINKINSTLTKTSNKIIKHEPLQNPTNTEPVIDNLDLTLDNIHVHENTDFTTDVTIKLNDVECDKPQEPPILEEKEEHKENQNIVEHNIIQDNINVNSITIDSEHYQNEHEHKEQIGNVKSEPEESIIPENTGNENVKKTNDKYNPIENIKNTTETKDTDSSALKRPASVRPSSSRPGAPRLREKNENIIGVENIVGGKVNIIAENTFNEEEEESSVVIIDDSDILGKVQEKDQLQTSDQHGHLVQQILDAQKEFTQATGKTEIEWQFGVQKARDIVNQEIDQIRFNVQALSRVANPLGKVLDHIQEDVEVMRQELNQWTTTYENASKELLKQKTANEEYLLPLYARIKQLDMDIAEKHYKINDLKIVIHKNASRIDKLLTSGIVQ